METQIKQIENNDAEHCDKRLDNEKPDISGTGIYKEVFCEIVAILDSLPQKDQCPF